MRRLHRFVVRLLPARFRAACATEMEITLASKHEEVAGAPRRRRCVFWAGELSDLFITLAREWWRAVASAMAGMRHDRRSLPATPSDLPGSSCPATRSCPSTSPFPHKTFEMLANPLADIRYAVRTLAGEPLFSSVVVLTLALGIGATTAVYTLVDSVLVRPLPFEEPHRLVYGFGSFPLNDRASMSPPDYLDYRDRSTSFETLAALGRGMTPVSIGGAGTPELASSRAASHEFLETFGAAPAKGRTFTADEARAGGPAVALISDGFWKQRFGADENVVGTALTVDDEATTIIGVLPAGFDVFGAPDIWLPMRFGGEGMTVRRFHFLSVIGRLRHDIDVSAAQAEIDAIAAELAAAYPDSNTDWTMRLVPLHQVAVGPVRQPLLLILAAVGAVLLIACCNVAILLLARSARRAPEIAMRHALGASDGRIVRLLLAESLLLAAAGGALGILLAYRGVDLLIAVSWASLPRVDEIAVDGSVLVFSVAVALGTGLLFGLAPALRSARRDIGGALRGQGRVAAGGDQRLRSGLVVGQVALSFALLVGAGLMARSFTALLRVEPGYAIDDVVAASIDLPAARYGSPEEARAFFDALFARLGAISIIDSAGGIDIAPLTSGNDTFAYPEGSPPEPGSQGFNAEVRAVTNGYFEAMGIPLVRGRSFSELDVAGGNPVVIIDEPFAATIFPGEDAVGKRIVVDLGEPEPAEIIGIVDGILHWGPALGSSDTMYFPVAQRARATMDVVVRTESDPAASVEALRAALAELDPELPLGGVRSMRDLASGSVAGPQFRARLLGVFAAAALMLAAAGLYAVLAYFVAERRREIGVRLALGADRGTVVRLVVGRGMRLVVVGLAFGGLAAVALSWSIQGLLYGVSSADPMSFIGVLAVLAVVSWIACLIPARRATRVDPLEAMRAE